MAHTHNSTKVLGAGELFLDPENDSGDLTGERSLGDTPGFSVSVEATGIDDYSSDRAVAELDVSVVTQVERSAKITCKDISLDNIGIFFNGDVKIVAQSGDDVIDEAINGVTPGRYYQLGRTADNPPGARKVSGVGLTDDGSTPASFAEGSDYEIDTETGRLYVVDGGNITQDTNLRVSYTPGAGNRARVKTGTAKAINGALRFIADNTVGPNRDLYGPKVTIKASGEFAMKSRDTIAQMEFDVKFLSSDRGEAIYVDERTLQS